MKKKNFVFDTNVLLHDPRAIYKFEDNDVILPIYVLEEVDTFKKNMSELGRNAREISRMLDDLREHGDLRDGVTLPNGGNLRVRFATHEDPHAFLSSNTPDNRILSVALALVRDEPDRECIFLTKDVNLRVRADALGLKTENYEERGVMTDQRYSGVARAHVDPEVISELVSSKSTTLDLDVHELFTNSEDDAARDPVGRLFVNEYVLLEHPDDGQSAFGRVSHVSEDGQHATLSRLKPVGDTVWGIKPRNKEQLFALDALLDESIDLVTLVGKAGTGKTLLAIAGGLKQVTDDQRHHKLLVSRPVVPMGRDIGFLPGTMEEKLGPWMRPIFDNVEYLMGLSRADKRAGRGADELIDMGLIELEALTYIRGRSLPNQYMIIDEAQNLTPHEVKTVLTRVGEGTKIVLTGDPQQIDNPYVDSESNGLSYVIERFKGQPRAASVTLFKGERSPLAELAADLL
jgi:PhoH-like ATPase